MPAMAGVGFSTHFCSGELKNIKVFSFAKQSCCSDDPEEDGCCKTEIKIVKLEKDQLNSSNKIVLKQVIQPVTFQSFIAPKILCT